MTQVQQLACSSLLAAACLRLDSCSCLRLDSLEGTRGAHATRYYVSHYYVSHYAKHLTLNSISDSKASRYFRRNWCGQRFQCTPVNWCHGAVVFPAVLPEAWQEARRPSPATLAHSCPATHLVTHLVTCLAIAPTCIRVCADVCVCLRDMSQPIYLSCVSPSFIFCTISISTHDERERERHQERERERERQRT
jgi:hypothetical protein